MGAPDFEIGESGSRRRARAFHPEHFNATLRSVANRSSEAALPPEVVAFVARQYKVEIATLANRLGGPATTWLRDAEAIIRTSEFGTARLGFLPPETKGAPRPRTGNRWWIKILAEAMYAAVAAAAMTERWRRLWGKVTRMAPAVAFHLSHHLPV